MVDSTVSRLPLIDVLRGLAVLAMISYHFSWDLAYHGFIAVDVAGDPLWSTYARLIAGSFLTLSGIGHVLAQRHGFNRDRFLVRLAKLAGAAALVSLGTYVIFPDAWVFFGILHMMAAGSLLVLPIIAMPSLIILLLAGLGWLAPYYLSSPLFDHPALWFLGLADPVPVSNDFVPVFPWIAPLLLGLVIGKQIIAFEPAVLRLGDGNVAGRILQMIGRYSLPIYLVHQVLLFSVVAGVASILPVDQENEQARFVGPCVDECVKSSDKATCSAFCSCVAGSLAPAGFFKVRGGDPEMSSLVATAAAACRPLEVAPPPN